MSKEDCLKYLELISAYLDDELSNGELIELADHLKTCATCSRGVDELASVKNILHKVEPFWIHQAPSENFISSLMDKLPYKDEMEGQAEMSGRSLKRDPRWFRRAGLWLSAAATTVFLLAGIYTYINYDRQATVAEKETPEARYAQRNITVTGMTEDFTLEEYFQEHAIGSSQALLFDDEDAVVFVSHE